MTRAIAPVVRKARLAEIDMRAERRAYWATQSVEARIAEVESLRRLWIELTGDPDLPMVRVARKRRLGDPAIRPPETAPDFEEANGRLVGRKLVVADHLDELIGILDLPGGTDAFIREIRGPGPDEIQE